MFYRIERLCLCVRHARRQVVHDLRRLSACARLRARGQVLAQAGRLDSVRHYLQGHFPVSANGDSYWAAAIHSEGGKLFIDLPAQAGLAEGAAVEIDLSSNVLITRS